MKICEYTRTELDYFEMACNFTPDEQKLFNYRSQDMSQEECADQMNMSVSTIKRLEKSIQQKIEREC